MEISQAVKSMTKQYLGRVLDSFTKDLGPQEEDEAREYIVRNAEELAKPDNVARRLDVFELDHSTRVLVYFFLESIINAPDCALSERDLVERIRQRETKLIDASEQEDALKYADDHGVDILQTVLETAFEDNRISLDEYRLIQRLRRKLGLTRRHQRLIEAQIDAFPKPDGRPHSHKQVNEALIHLQKQGIIFYCNRVDDGREIVLPDELQPGVKEVLGIELSDDARRLLWKNLSVADLKEILRSQNLPVYGTKDELVERLMSSDIRPSEGLSSLMSEDLYDICSKLPGVNVSGTKEERVERIVTHFDNLLIRQLPEEAEEGELYYEYFVQLAERDRENLLANEVIDKDRDIEDAFEEGTRYLFQHKLGIDLAEMPGNNHPDGMVDDADETLFMWDNKSSADVYTFPNTHLRQFKRYIRDSVERRVGCFMIIVPDIDESAEANCIRLKHESQHDADVAIITAEDLKWVAENWNDYTSSDDFNLAVFDQTGIVERKKLEQMMDVLL